MSNFLSNIEFRFTIRRLPKVSFFIQTANIPGITAGAAEVPTPFKMTHFAPDKLEFEDLVITCVLDENIESYTETWNWLVDLSNPLNFEGYKKLTESDDGPYSDATLTILDSKKNAKIELTFEDLFPLSVSTVEFDTKQTSVEPPTVDLTFRYKSYSIKVYS